MLSYVTEERCEEHRDDCGRGRRDSWLKIIGILVVLIVFITGLTLSSIGANTDDISDNKAEIARQGALLERISEDTKYIRDRIDSSTRK